MDRIKSDKHFAKFMIESVHPLYLNILKYKQMRFQKIEKSVPGFSVPNWVSNEVEQVKFIEAFADLVALHKKYQRKVQRKVEFKCVFDLR